MAVINADELRGKATDQLDDVLLSSLNEQFRLRMQSSSSEQQVQPHLIKEIRRNIARIKTVLNERRVGKGQFQTVADDKTGS